MAKDSAGSIFGGISCADVFITRCPICSTLQVRKEFESAKGQILGITFLFSCQLFRLSSPITISYIINDEFVLDQTS